MKIDPERLKTLRTRLRLSRKNLADKSRVSARQIARIEAGKSRTGRENTVTRLAAALNVEIGILTGDKPLPDGRPEAETTSVQISSTISPQRRLEYDLVKRRYGLSARHLINWAPLLFVLLAEGSLAWRRQKLKEVKEAAGCLSELGKTYSHLYFAYCLDQVKAGYETEQESIDKADLLGDVVRDKGFSGSAGCFFPDDALFDVTPFYNYLFKFAADLEVPGIINFWLESFNPHPDEFLGMEPHNLFRDDLDEITGGSIRARLALDFGDVRLSEIPEGLMSEEAKDKRVAWLESRLSDSLMGIAGLIEASKDPEGDER